jgi:formyltetrahydrofolate-dependent phosphoribosylglycinamide formyltransferase
MKIPIRLAVLLSGGGTTLQNLIDQQVGTIACVISSRADAGGLERARRAGIPAHVVQRRDHPNTAHFSHRILDLCHQAHADLVCMAGFLQLLTIPDQWCSRVMNVHPSLLPAFGGKGFHGLHVHTAALEAGVKISGCTVHFANNEYDRGPIIVQKAVPVHDDDTPETLQARVFAAECQAYPEAIALFAAGRLRITGQRVRIAPA